MSKLYNTYDIAFSQATEILSKYYDLHMEEIDDIIVNDHQEFFASYQHTLMFLTNLIAFFEKYQQWVTSHRENPANRPQPESLLSQYNSSLYPGTNSVSETIKGLRSGRM